MNEHQKDSPEVRTAAFFEADPYSLAEELIQEDLVIAAGNKKIKVVEAKPYARVQVGKQYSAMNQMNPGDVWHPPVRQILQTLVVAKDVNGVGACVRIMEAEYYDPKSRQFVPVLETEDGKFGPREGDIAKYFGKGKFERSKLRFQNKSNTLHLVDGGEFTER